MTEARDVLREAGIEYRFERDPWPVDGEIIVRRADVERLIAERDEARAQYEVEHAHRLEDLEDNFRLDDELAIARRELEEAQRRSTPAGRVAPSVPGRLPEIVCDDRVGLGELWIVDPVTEGVIGKIENLAREDARAAGVSGEVPASDPILDLHQCQINPATMRCFRCGLLYTLAERVSSPEGGCSSCPSRGTK